MRREPPDGLQSPCVDGGEPNAALSEEPMPNGSRINMGAYGGTWQASMSEWPLAGDLNFDGIVNFKDMTIAATEWLEEAAWK